MVPMTPLQSWALLALLVMSLILAACALVELDLSTARRKTTEGLSKTRRGLDKTTSTERPIFTRPKPDPGSTQVYDWAKQGL